MKPTRLIWVVLLMAAALCCWLFIPSVQPTRISYVNTPDNPQHTFLLGSTISGATNSTITGILTDPQFRVVIRALEQRGGADLLSAPKVTTISGRSINQFALDKTLVFTNR